MKLATKISAVRNSPLQDKTYIAETSFETLSNRLYSYENFLDFVKCIPHFVIKIGRFVHT